MKTKKILGLALAVASVFAMTGCKKEEAPVEPLKLYGNEDDMYARALGEFEEVLTEANAEVTNIPLRYAKQAVAEAKLLESGVMFLTRSKGGAFGLTRLAPKGVSPCLYGSDADNQKRIVVAQEPITAADRATLLELYAEKLGTGTYHTAVKAKLQELGYTVKDEYIYAYTSDPTNWDCLATSKQADTEPVVQTFDRLYEYDVENAQVPALALSHVVSPDNKTYTFTLRQGVYWYDKDDKPVAEVKADDWVAAFEHMKDTQSGLEELVFGIVKNYKEYCKGEKTIADVGVKAINDYTLQFELEEVTPYFLTMLGYNCFSPLCRTYYVAKGGKFGEAYDPTADDYKYAKTPDDLVHCGAFKIKNWVKNNTIEFEKNANYWNKDDVFLNKIKWTFTDGKNETELYEKFKLGEVDAVGLTDPTIALAKTEKPVGKDGTWYDDYKYVTDCDATSFCGWLNVNRQAFNNYDNVEMGISGKTNDQKVATRIAMNNQAFRLALCMSIDRVVYNGKQYGEDLAANSLINSYTPGTFVSLAEAVTMKIYGTKAGYENGKEIVFPKGTQYGQIVQAQLDADESPIQAWNTGLSNSIGYDGWYHPAEAKAYLKEALQQEVGLICDKENPIHIDLPTQSTNAVNVAQAQVIKKCIEDNLEGYVVVDIVEFENRADWLSACYNFEKGNEANFDISTLSGWGPDFGDPSTYLNTLLPDGKGYMTINLGMY